MALRAPRARARAHARRGVWIDFSVIVRGPREKVDAKKGVRSNVKID